MSLDPARTSRSDWLWVRAHTRALPADCQSRVEMAISDPEIEAIKYVALFFFACQCFFMFFQMFCNIPMALFLVKIKTNDCLF